MHVFSLLTLVWKKPDFWRGWIHLQVLDERDGAIKQKIVVVERKDLGWVCIRAGSLI